jgi:bis(5'-adenosyl)-triphosphatase
MAVCPFCSDEVRGLIFFENQLFFAVCNQAPILPGHSLVIPKRHVQKVSGLTAEESQQLFPFVQKVNLVLSKAFQTDSFDISIQDGEPAGQTVMHLHVHVIPRITGDLPSPGDWYQELMNTENPLLDSHKRPKLEKEQLAEIANRLRIIAKEIFKE